MPSVAFQYIIKGSHERLVVSYLLPIRWHWSYALDRAVILLPRESGIGCWTFVLGSLVTWSKKQNMVTRTSTRAKYRSMANIDQTRMHIQPTLQDVGSHYNQNLLWKFRCTVHHREFRILSKNYQIKMEDLIFKEVGSLIQINWATIQFKPNFISPHNAISISTKITLYSHRRHKEFFPDSSYNIDIECKQYIMLLWPV